jgi:inosose dehydratase
MKLGFAPITWNNEDLRGELGPPVAYTTVLDEVASAGYVGTELGDGFPREPTMLRRALDQRGLRLPSAWCGLSLRAASQRDDLEHARRLCGLLADTGATFVNLAHQAPPDAFTDAPTWDELASCVCQAAEVARAHGLQAAFHVHAGTWVESRADLDELLRRAPAPLLKLCWDVGHALVGGIDPIEVIRAYPERIAYVHLKDVDGDVLDAVRRDGASFRDAVRRRVFTQLGWGRLNVPGVLDALRSIGYDDWLMVEQDSSWLPPLESAQASRSYLRTLGL